MGEFKKLQKEDFYEKASPLMKMKFIKDLRHYSLESGCDANHEFYRLLDEVIEQNKKLIEALRFYANYLNYTMDDYHGISGEMKDYCVLYRDMDEINDCTRHAGSRARAVLKEIGANP